MNSVRTSFSDLTFDVILNLKKNKEKEEENRIVPLDNHTNKFRISMVYHR